MAVVMVAPSISAFSGLPTAFVEARQACDFALRTAALSGEAPSCVARRHFTIVSSLTIVLQL
jgi:hypothetical protein